MFVLAASHFSTQVFQDQRALTVVSLLTYVIALVVAYFAMPVFWHRPFLAGVNWNGSRVKWWMGLGGPTSTTHIRLQCPAPTSSHES